MWLGSHRRVAKQTTPSELLSISSIQRGFWCPEECSFPGWYRATRRSRSSRDRSQSKTHHANPQLVVPTSPHFHCERFVRARFDFAAHAHLSPGRIPVYIEKPEPAKRPRGAHVAKRSFPGVAFQPTRCLCYTSRTANCETDQLPVL